MWITNEHQPLWTLSGLAPECEFHFSVIWFWYQNRNRWDGITWTPAFVRTRFFFNTLDGRFQRPSWERLSIKLKVSELKGIRRLLDSLLKATFRDDFRGRFRVHLRTHTASLSLVVTNCLFCEQTRSQRNDKWHKKLQLQRGKTHFHRGHRVGACECRCENCHTFGRCTRSMLRRGSIEAWQRSEVAGLLARKHK